MKACCLPPLAALLSAAVLLPVRLQLSSGFVPTVPATKKPLDGAGGPSGAPFASAGRHRAPASAAAKGGVPGDAGDGAIRSDIAIALNDAERKGRKGKAPAAGPGRRRAKPTDPPYWRDEGDPFSIAAGREARTAGAEAEGGGGAKGGAGGGKSARFTIRGNPSVLQRHRTARGFVYNPSRARQEAFRDCLLEILPREHRPVALDGGGPGGGGGSAASPPAVLFAEGDYVELSITFRMKRPMSHFIGNKPAVGRLKPTAPGKLHAIRSDVDNLAKFVMDSLNGLLYVDDRQVVRLNAIKVLDSEGLCRGATEIEITALGEDDFV